MIFKVRLKSVVDGKWVNIFVLFIIVMGGWRRLGGFGDGCLGLSV